MTKHEEINEVIAMNNNAYEKQGIHRKMAKDSIGGKRAGGSSAPKVITGDNGSKYRVLKTIPENASLSDYGTMFHDGYWGIDGVESEDGMGAVVKFSKKTQKLFYDIQRNKNKIITGADDSISFYTDMPKTLKDIKRYIENYRARGGRHYIALAEEFERALPWYEKTFSKS